MYPIKKIFIIVLFIVLSLTSLSCLGHTHHFDTIIAYQEASDFIDGYEKRMCDCGKVEEYILPAKRFSWSSYQSNGALSYISNALNDFDFTYNENYLYNVKDNIIADVEKENSTSLEQEINDLNDYISQIEDIKIVANTYFYLYSDKTEYQTGVDEINVIIADYYDFISNDLLSVAQDKNDEIKMLVFNTSDEKEILEIIETYKFYADISKVNIEIEKLQNDFRVYMIDYPVTTQEFVKFGAETLKKELDLFWKVADQYPDMDAYDVASLGYYNRQYSASDLEIVLNGIKDDLAPKFGKMNLKVLTKQEDVDKTNSLLSSPMTDKEFFNAKYFSEYAEFMKGSFADFYADLWCNGAYAFSDSDSSLGTAYISLGNNISVAYFSSNYQKLDSVIHEFGHYYGMKQEGMDEENKDFDESYDILETHSQGNEALFYNFLKTTYHDDPAIKLYADYEYYQFITGLLSSSMVSYVEINAINNRDITVEEIIKLGEEANKYYNATDYFYTNFWAYAAASPLYYASYITSAAASLQLYNEDLEVAKEKYIAFCSQEVNKTEEEKWTDAGFISPFDKNLYITLGSELEEILK